MRKTPDPKSKGYHKEIANLRDHKKLIEQINKNPVPQIIEKTQKVRNRSNWGIFEPNYGTPTDNFAPKTTKTKLQVK